MTQQIICAVFNSLQHAVCICKYADCIFHYKAKTTVEDPELSPVEHKDSVSISPQHEALHVLQFETMVTWYLDSDLFLKVNASAVIVPVILLLLALIVIVGILICESKLRNSHFQISLQYPLVMFIYKMKCSFSIVREAKEENQSCVRHVSQSLKCYLIMLNLKLLKTIPKLHLNLKKKQQMYKNSRLKYEFTFFIMLNKC